MTIDCSAPPAADTHDWLDSADRAGGLIRARSAFREVEGKIARIAYLRTLFAAARDRGFEPGVAFSLRELRKIDLLSLGEGRRLFMALDRMKRAALIDRYVQTLHRGLPKAATPMRKALNVVWSTGRSGAILDYIRAHHPKRLTDRETIGAYAAHYTRFKDLKRTIPLFTHLAALDPADASLRIGLARGWMARGDHKAAVEHCLAAKELGALPDDVGQVADALYESLHEAIASDPSAPALEQARRAFDLLAPLDPDHPRRSEIARMLAIADQSGRRVKPLTPTTQRLKTLAEAVELLSRARPKTRPHRLMAEAAGELLGTIDLTGQGEALDHLLRLSPGLAAVMADRFMAAPDAAIVGATAFRGLAPDHAAAVWIPAIKLAAFARLEDDAAVFADRLAAIPDAPVKELRNAANALSEDRIDRIDRIDRFWRIAAAANASDRVVPTALRALYGHQASVSFYDIACGAATGTLRGTIDAPLYVDAIRTALARAWRWSDAAAIDDLTPDAIDPGLSPALALWTRAVAAWANFRYDEARALLDEGTERWPSDAPVSFRSERALLAVRFGEYGAAAADIADIAVTHPRDASDAALDRARAIIRAAPPPADALYPQYLIDALFDRDPVRRYDPVPGSLVTIVAALSSGGSERQAVSVIEALMRDPRVAAQSLLIRSVTPGRRAFFLPQVAASGVALHVFEHDPANIAHMLALLDEPPGSALSVALPLLPEPMRGTICQLVPLLLDRRPAVVHIRQDFFAAALACVLAGVPRFLIHRGSLTPDHWDLSVPQDIATTAPMRHVYRRLVSWPGFGFINNACSGVSSDREWTGGDDPARYTLVHNIVDFARLGPSSSPDDTVRASIGAAPGDLVVGAAFRFHRVKRPLLWLAAAKHILTRHPEARFLILGDGEMKDAMTGFAKAEGFADRLHLPGSVSDLGRWYRAMDVALLTSDREGLPNMLIEAQHFGVVPVSTDVGGAAETMEAGVTGRLVAADASAEAIGDAVVDAFDDRAWFAHARATAPGLAHERFGAKATIDQLVGLYGFADSAGEAL